MKKLHFILFITVVFISNIAIFSKPLFAQEKQGEPITVTTQVDQTTISIGDKIKYTITVEAKPELKVELPQFAENLGGFAIKDFGQLKPKKRKGWMVYQQWYLLDTYTTGSYTIPAPVIRYTEADGTKREIKGKEVTVEVKSVLSEGEEPQDIRDIAEPVKLPVSYTRFILWIVVALVLIAGGVTTLLLLKRRKKAAEEVPKKPAHVIAYEQLEELISSGLIEQRRIEEYYVLLSDTIRAYLENRFGLRAPEMTTEEFLDAVANDSNLKYEHKTLLSDFLTHCDLVKFARYGPDEGEMKSAYESAKRFVDETVPAATQLEETY
ncbi:MAG: hypothetical protein ACE5PV_15715 [Candidatus Poribacteria bacterium]